MTREPLGYDVQRLVYACEVLGDEKRWFRPARYHDSLALCIVDSIQSTGSHYNSVRNVVARYRIYRRDDTRTDGTAELLQTFSELGGIEGWMDEIGNRKPASTRRGAASKAAVIRQVAQNLHDAGVRSTDDLRAVVKPRSGDELRYLATKKLWTSVEAQSSGLTWNYALMLAGVPGVKADRMVIRFVRRALGNDECTPSDAATLVRHAADVMRVSATDLDHAIWRKESNRAVSIDPFNDGEPVLEDEADAALGD